MGRLIIALCRDESGLRIAGAVEAPGHPVLGEDAGSTAGGHALGVRIEKDLAAIVRREHIVVDFTGVPDVAVRHAALAVERGAALVVGTTGFDVRQREEMAALATRTRSVVAANFSVGVTVLTELVTLAARLRDRNFEPAIGDLHHTSKEDARSHTALT